MKSDAALEWIAQQCETTQPQVVPRWMYASSRTMGWMYMMSWNHHLVEDQYDLCIVVVMDELNDMGHATELMGTE